MSDEERQKLASMIRTYAMIAPHQTGEKIRLMNQILDYMDKLVIEALRAPHGN